MGSEVGFEATGLVDGSLHTLGVWAKKSEEVCACMMCYLFFLNHVLLLLFFLVSKASKTVLGVHIYNLGI